MKGLIPRTIGPKIASEDHPNLVKTSEIFYPSYSLTTNTYSAALKHYEEYIAHGYDIVDFHKRVNNGELLPHTPWTEKFFQMDVEVATFSVDQVKANTGEVYATDTYSNENGKFGRQSWLDLDALNMKSHVDIDSLDEFVQGAAAKIYNTGFDVSTFVAEMGDLRRTFLGLVNKLAGIKKGLIKKGLKNPKKAIYALEETYLELRYGWRPLMYDIVEFDETLRNFEERRTRWSERVGITETWSSNSEETIDLGVYGGNQHAAIADVWTLSKRGSVTADVMLDKWKTNAALTGWEIIPFSFVVDWFLSVGQAISASSLLLSADAVASSAGYKITRERTIQSSVSDNPQTNITYVHDTTWTPESSSKIVYSERIPTSVPISPQVAVNLDAYKVADAVALLHQLLRGKKGRRSDFNVTKVG